MCIREPVCDLTDSPGKIRVTSNYEKTSDVCFLSITLQGPEMPTLLPNHGETSGVCFEEEVLYMFYCFDYC